MTTTLVRKFVSTVSCAAVFAGSSGAQVVVNEFLASPDGVQQEYVELLNIGDEPVPLASIAFRDGRSGWIPAAPESTVFLLPDELLVLSAEEQPVWPDVVFLRPTGWASLNNSGDSILVRVDARVTDRVGYAGNERGRSTERIDPVIPGHVSDNWAPSVDPTGGSPGRRNSRYRPDRTPPRLLDAEFAPPAALMLWFSEPPDPASLGEFRMEPADLPRALTGADLEDALLVVPLGMTDPPAAVTAGGLADFAGHVMPDTTVAVAYPPTPGDVILSELLVEAGTRPNDLPEFVEIASSAMRPVSLRGVRLEIGSGPEPDRVLLAGPDSTRILHPGAVLLVYAAPRTGETAEHVRFLVENALPARPGAEDSAGHRIEILAADPTDIALRNAGDLVRVVSAHGPVLDAVTYGPELRDIRFGNHRGRSIRRVRTTGNPELAWVSTLDDSGTTPGRAETETSRGIAPVPGDLVFSELMPRPLADPVDGRVDQPEYIEVANVSGAAVELNGLVISGPVNDDGERDARRIVFQPLVLEPDAVAVVYELPGAVGDTASDQFTYLADAFAGAYPSGIGFGQVEASLGRGGILSNGRGLLIPVRGAVGLRDDGELLRLVSEDDVVIDSVSYSPAMHHPAVADPTGRALERTVLSLTPLRLGAWSTSSGPGGGTPGLLPPRPGPPPSPGDSGPTARLRPKTISPDGDGVRDRTVIVAGSLTEGTVVRADIFDIDGRHVRTLTPGTITDGTFTAEWSGLDDRRRPVARGFYVVLIHLARADGRGGRAFKLPVAVVR